MLLKFTTSDMLNTHLIDSRTGMPAYTILSRSHFILGEKNKPIGIQSRRTWIHDQDGKVVAEICWAGRQPESVRILDEVLDDSSELFDGCTSVRFLPKALYVPTRLDYVWVATRESLLLLDSDLGTIQAKFHPKCIQVGTRLLPSNVPGLGVNFLELNSTHSEAVTVELIVDFLLVEIMRRGRFKLAPYVFDRPQRVKLQVPGSQSLYPIEEAPATAAPVSTSFSVTLATSFAQKLRRNTV